MATATKKIEPGITAPDFELIANNGRTMNLSYYWGRKNVVLYFYPKDDTPGCVTEACGFREVMDDLFECDTIVLGISPDNMSAHQKFIAKYYLPFLLLSDPNKDACNKYGVWGEKSMYGKKYMGVLRTTFIIGKDGKILKIFEKVKPAEHGKEVLAYVKTLNRLSVRMPNKRI